MGKQNGARPTASEVGAVPPSLNEELLNAGEPCVDLPDTDGQETRMKIMSKAMELPLMSGLTSTVAATSEYIYSSRPMSMVTGMMNETIKQAGEREDVKSVISTMNVIYAQNLEKRVEDLKVTLNPHVEKIDNLACGGIDKINEKLAETKDVYVAPVVDKINDTKEVYVDPVINKAMDIKEKTTQVVASASESIAGAKTDYIDPALKTAEDIKESYVEPAVKMTQEYITPVMIQAYNDPATAYGDMVQLGKEVAIITKDKTVEEARRHAENARDYLNSTRETMANKVHNNTQTNGNPEQSKTKTNGNPEQNNTQSNENSEKNEE